MAFYRYTALDTNGTEQTGTLEAASPRDAATLLRSQDLRILRVEDAAAASEEKKSITQIDINEFLPVGLSDRVLFFQQMALMLRSGLSVLQGLEVAGDLALSARLKKSITRVADRIKSGDNFSTAMESEGRMFPSLAIQLIRSAEASGELDLVLERIASHLEQKATTRRNLITSLVYPTVVLFISIGVGAFLLVGVVPKFAEFFQRSSQQLPGITQGLVDVSAAVTRASPYILAGTLIGIAALIYFYSKPASRLVIDRALLRTPVVGNVLIQASLSQTAWAMAMLLKSGVTLLESIRVGTELVTNKALERALLDASEDLLAGKDFSTSIDRYPIPSLVIRLSAVGERSGSLEHVMQELGDHYDLELQASIKRMSNLIEPLLMLVVGTMVGFVYFAFFQAIFSMI